MMRASMHPTGVYRRNVHNSIISRTCLVADRLDHCDGEVAEEMVSLDGCSLQTGGGMASGRILCGQEGCYCSADGRKLCKCGGNPHAHTCMMYVWDGGVLMLLGALVCSNRLHRSFKQARRDVLAGLRPWAAGPCE